MAIFQSLAGSLKALAVGDRVKVTLRPESGRFFPLEGRILHKDEAGNFSLQSDGGIVQVRAVDILSISAVGK
jgi:hypothetical protein